MPDMPNIVKYEKQPHASSGEAGDRYDCASCIVIATEVNILLCHRDQQDIDLAAAPTVIVPGAQICIILNDLGAIIIAGLDGVRICVLSAYIVCSYSLDQLSFRILKQKKIMI